MKEGFTFNKVSLMFLRKVIFKNFGGGGGEQKRARMSLPKREITSSVEEKAANFCFSSEEKQPPFPE